MSWGVGREWLRHVLLPLFVLKLFKTRRVIASLQLLWGNCFCAIVAVPRAVVFDHEGMHTFAQDFLDYIYFHIF